MATPSPEPERFPDHFKWNDDGGVPVIYPTMDEFKDFKKFIKQIEPFGMARGIVKVVPPEEWVADLPQLDEHVKDIKIKNPIMQTFNGSGGLYKLQNIEKQRTYNIAEWKNVCNEPDHLPPAPRGQRRGFSSRSNNSIINGKENDSNSTAKRRLKRTKENAAHSLQGFDYRFDDNEFTNQRCEELEKTYWKGLTYNSPIYGADMPGSLFDDKTTVWNVAHLDNLLNNLDLQIPGVNSAYLYCGMWKATFAWHLEDMDLFSINYIHFGAPKQWYSISQCDNQRFYNVMKDLWPVDQKTCKEFLRHKTFHASPALLRQHGIKVNKVVHHQHEFMITFPYGYHSGFNYGYNVAESLNFAMESWLPIGKVSNRCQCITDSVGIDIDQLVRHMKGEYTDDEGSPAAQLPTPPYIPQETKLKRRLKHTNKDKRKQEKRILGDKNSINKTKKKKLKLEKLHQQDQCLLCPNIYNNNDFIQDDNGAQVHRLCALYIPETPVSDKRSVGISSIPDVRKNPRCMECGSNRGACLQCSIPTCSRSYHATCAEFAGVLASCHDHDNSSQMEFLCRFHRPKRPSTDMLEHDKLTLNWAYSLLPGDTVQCQFGNGAEIFAGIVEDNRRSEQSILVRSLPTGSELIEVDWKWVRHPAKVIGSNSVLYGIQESLNTSKKHNTKSTKRLPGSAPSNNLNPKPNNRPSKANHYKGEKVTFIPLKGNINNMFAEDLGYGWATQGLNTLQHDDSVCGNGLYPFHFYDPLISTMADDRYIYL